MNCRDLEELISAYADGELPRTQKEFIEEHLAACADCRAVLADYERAGRLLSSLQKMPGNQDISSAALARIKTGNTLPGKLSRRRLRSLVTALAVTAVIAVFLVLQPWNRNISEVAAATIVRNSPEIRAFFNDEHIAEVKVTTRVLGTEGETLVVLVKTETGTAAAEVDLKKKVVTDIVRVHVPGLTEMDEQKAVEIASGDPGVRKLLAAGGVISEVTLGHAVTIKETVNQDGQAVKEGEVAIIGRVTIEAGSKKWLAGVDVTGGKILELKSISPTARIMDWSQTAFKILNPLLILLGVLTIPGLALGNRLASATAGTISIVVGILTLYCGVYVFPASQGERILVLVLAAMGSIIGIIDYSLRIKRRQVPAAGIVLCSLALACCLAVMLTRNSGVGTGL